jgi:cysteine desulfurase/selenocysteine lyase
MSLDVRRVRRDFPILSSGVIYLDSAASSLTPEQVVGKMLEFYREYRANVERGVHRLSERATEEFLSAREEVRRFINAGECGEVIFTKNATEGINMVAAGLRWRKGEKIVTTIAEHHSNLIPWQRISRRFGVRVEIVKPEAGGEFSAADFERVIDRKTKLVAVSHVSNVLGCRLPVGEIVEIAGENGARVLVDGAQSVPRMPVDVREMGCDFLAFSGHKMLGPTGVGVLYVRRESLRELEPLVIGGGSIGKVSSEGYELAPPPHTYEGGTPPIAEAIGLGEAVRYLRRCGMESVLSHERKLTERMHVALSGVDGVEVYGPEDPGRRFGIVAFNVADLDPNDVAVGLDRMAMIAVRSGHHCAMPLHVEFLQRSEGSVRASVYIYNTRDEIDKLAECVERIARRSRTGRRSFIRSTRG